VREWKKDICCMDVHIIDVDAAFELLAAMRYLIVDTATMRKRIP